MKDKEKVIIVLCVLVAIIVAVPFFSWMGERDEKLMESAADMRSV